MTGLDHFSRTLAVSNYRFVEFSAEDTDFLEQAIQLRAYVWNQQSGQTLFADAWTDEHDQHACHWGVLLPDNRLVASARLCIHERLESFPDYSDIKHLSIPSPPPPIGMMNRLVVHPDFQRQGIAKGLDRLRVQKAVRMSCNSAVIEIPDYRRGSIESLGFEYIGEAVEKSEIAAADLVFDLYIKDLRSPQVAPRISI